MKSKSAADSFERDFNQLLGRLNRRIEKDFSKLQAWLNLMDELGYAIITREPKEPVVYRLNVTAKEDLDLKCDELADMPESLDREIIVQDSEILLWVPAIQNDNSSRIETLLTKRQKEVWHWKKQGKSLEETAIIMGISIRTVSKHRENITKILKDVF